MKESRKDVLLSVANGDSEMNCDTIRPESVCAPLARKYIVENYISHPMQSSRNHDVFLKIPATCQAVGKNSAFFRTLATTTDKRELATKNKYSKELLVVEYTKLDRYLTAEEVAIKVKFELEKKNKWKVDDIVTEVIKLRQRIFRRNETARGELEQEATRGTTTSEDDRKNEFEKGILKRVDVGLDEALLNYSYAL